MRRISFSGLLLGMLCCSLLQASAQYSARYQTIGYLLPGGELTSEDSAALAFLKSTRLYTPQLIRLDTLRGALPEALAYWVHVPDSVALAKWDSDPRCMTVLRAAWDSGKGRFLFTDLAALFPHRMGLEEAAPEVQLRVIKSDGVFDQKGAQARLPGSLFPAELTGMYYFDPVEDVTVPLVGYFGGRRPITGLVEAVEKSYITIHSDNATILWYQEAEAAHKNRVVGAVSSILSIGGYVYLTHPNGARRALKEFLETAISRFDNGEENSRRNFWEAPARVAIPAPFVVVPKILLHALARRAGGATDYLPEILDSARMLMQRRITAHDTVVTDEAGSGLAIARDTASADFCDLAGRSVLLMGKERGGIDELWFHPVRFVKDYRAGLIIDGSLRWLDEFPCSITILPERIERTYTTPAGVLRERLVTSPEQPVAVAQYTTAGASPMRLFLRLESDFRMQWPYDAGMLGGLEYSYDEPTGSLHVRNTRRTGERPLQRYQGLYDYPQSDEYSMLFFADRLPLQHRSGAYTPMLFGNDGIDAEADSVNTVRHAAVYALGNAPADTLSVTIAAGLANLFSQWLSPIPLLKSSIVFRDAAAYERKLLRTSLTIDSPDSSFNALYRWALVGTERFRTKTYDNGPALTAGIGTTARGWDGGHKVSGRPGYAWWFGRDAAWSSLAVSGYGDFNLVQAQLSFFALHQDPFSGKILHEMSTSDVVHYDAADATPLYLILAAQYLRASRDTGTIRSMWPSLSKAFTYLQSTDTDGDGLIENSSAGHGWVEGGPLFGVHTEFYLAGVWARALRDMQSLCGAFRAKRDPLAAKAEVTLQSVNTLLGKPAVANVLRTFWNDSARSFRHGLYANGSWHNEATALAAVPVLLLADDPLFTENAPDLAASMRRLAGNDFTSDWGARIVSERSPLFNPGGYHEGSVWPLFTGWAASAEYATGRSLQGWTHVMQTARIANHWAKGFIEEVMNGAVYEPSGVCAHQCWSETAVLHPLIEGMIGWKPDAIVGSDGRPVSQLRPRFPMEWDTATVRNLRVGNTRMELTLSRSDTATTYTVRVTERGGVAMEFAPEIPEGARILGVEVSGFPVQGDFIRNHRGLLDPPLRFTGDAMITVRHSGGAGMLAELPDPAPGDSSLGYRIVDDVRPAPAKSGFAYTVSLEGRAGTTREFTLRTFDQPVTKMKRAKAFAQRGNRCTFTITFPKSKNRYSAADIFFSLGKGKRP